MDKTHPGSKSIPFPITTLFKQQPKNSEKMQVTYRIPALIYISDNQTFLAFAEKRKTANDTDADVLVMKKGIWKDGEVKVSIATLTFSHYCTLCTLTQAMWDVDEFNNFLHQKRFGIIQCDITCSSMDPLQWMGAIVLRVQPNSY